MTSVFTLYTTPLSGAIIFSSDINHHIYADDTQIYMSLSVSNAKESLAKLQHCLMGLSAWMTGSKLKLDPSKTEFRLIGTKLQREKFLHYFPCLILGQDTNPSTSAKNLVVFDSSLNFRKHIPNMYGMLLSYPWPVSNSKKTICQKRISLDNNVFRTALQEW